MAQTLPVKLGNDRQLALPDMDRIVYSKEPEYYKKKSANKNKKPLSTFSLAL